MARYGRSIAQSLLSKLTRSSPLTSRTLCSGAPIAPASYAEGVDGDEAKLDGSRRVAVFWDLDNKPPKNVPPYDAAVRLVEMAAGFGEVVDVAAYANRYAFAYLPRWVKEQRRERKHLDRLERAGVVKPAEPYVCGYCGRRCKTNEKLKKHFRDLHERERNKRMNRLNSLKGGKRDKFRASLSEKEERYKNAAREVIVPKVGYGLAGELRRAGVYVRMVSDKSQAADEALKLHMHRSIRHGINCVCLVSDDSDFANILKLAQSKHLHTVVVGDTCSLARFADEQFSWQEVASGSALARANEVHELWSFEDGFHDDDSYERRRERARNLGYTDSDDDDDDLDEKFTVSEKDEDEEVWPMESSGNKNREKEKVVLRRSDFWWLPAPPDDDDDNNDTNTNRPEPLNPKSGSDSGDFEVYLQRFVVREQALDYQDFAVQLPGIASRRGSWPGYYRGSAVYKTGSAKQGIQIIESYSQR